MHAYKQDTQSGAGNCTCGASEHHVRHPHQFREAWIWAQRVGEVQCVCSRPKSDPVHHSSEPEHGSINQGDTK
jgi:hypothetical protein